MYSTASSSSSDFSSAYATPTSVTPACSNPSLTSSSRTSGYGTLPVTPACSTDTLCPAQLSSSRDTLINSSRDSLVDGAADDLPLPPPPCADYEQFHVPSGGSDYQQIVAPSGGDYQVLPLTNGIDNGVPSSEHFDELDTVGALRSELRGACLQTLVMHTYATCKEIKTVTSLY